MLMRWKRLWLNRYTCQEWKLGLIILSLMTVITVSSIPAIAQQITQATVTEILPRSSSLVYIQNRSVRKGSVAYQGEQVRTGQATAALKFNVPAGIRLAPNSTLIVNSQCVQLVHKGSVMLAGKGTRGCVGGITAASRATVYILELNEIGEAKVIVLEGVVDVAGAERSIQVNQRQQLTATADGQLGKVEPLSQAEFNAILNGPLFRGFREPLPGLAVLTATVNDSGFGRTFLQDALTGRDFVFEERLPSTGAFIPNGLSEDGIFTRTGKNQAVFTPTSAGTVRVFQLDVDEGEILSVNGTSVSNSTFGLSGNAAAGTIQLSNGQFLRLEVFGVNGEEPEIAPNQPSSFSGRITPGIAPDR
ncbi:hypothetical protein [Pantanalinema sp. GBBB05]|uniref:hypothetical protein n=1 Tax=Pantanalinema sp. GBBB05 TaxID=2604139 RepID=UPI001DEE1F94|nr:hypothetical protein [Pantanalinema sp. GBBB05]